MPTADVDLTSLGIGGILAGLLFIFYRKDVQHYTDQWKGQSEILIQVVRDNTESNTKLITLIDALHRRMDGEFHFRKTERHKLQGDEHGG